MAYRAKGPDVESLWRPLVSCVAAAEEDHEPGDAREILRQTLRTSAPPSGWEVDEVASIPGTPRPAHSGPAAHSPAPTALVPHPSPTRAPPQPPATSDRLLTLSLTGIQGHTVAIVRSTLLTALGCEVLLPDIAAPFIKNVWRIRVPASAWKQAARDETTLTIYTVTDAPLILESAPRHPFLHHCAPMMAASPPPCVSGCRAV